jgi:[ribosomal protein S18]-alanine N-acetyltransferase
LNIRTMEARDIDAVLAIQSACPETAQWVMWDYNRAAAGEMAGWIAEENGEVIGFLVGRPVVSDFEILNFAVAPAARRRGAGAALLQQAIEFGKSIHAENTLLEVRASNLAALQFYERRDFRATGRRRRYYTAPVEDALVLTLRLAERA